MTRDSGNWRSEHGVLVPEANALGAIAVIRSLGRAGYQVHACSSRHDALGLSSNYATYAAVCPRYSSREFVPWLRAYIAENDLSVIIPSEGFLHAISEHYGEFQCYMHLSADESVVYRAFSKIDVAGALQAAPADVSFSTHGPPGLILRRSDPLPAEAELRQLPLPLYLKSDAKYCRIGAEPFFKRLESHAEARGDIDEAFRSYDALLLQGHVPGVKAAAAFCLEGSNVIAQTEVLGLRTTPHTGGMMCLRSTARTESLATTSLRWLKHLDWVGVAMMECKWDPTTGQFWFIELNPRYWGYLHLDLFSGVDVPRIQVDHFLGRGESEPPPQKLGVISRHTVPGDVGHLLSVIRDDDVANDKKFAAAVRFGWDFLNPFMHSDLLFPGDRKLYWQQWLMFFRELLGRAGRRKGAT